MTQVVGITALALVALGWRPDWRDVGALDITLTNLARTDHSSAESRVISLQEQGCSRTTRRARARNAYCSDSKVRLFASQANGCGDSLASQQPHLHQPPQDHSGTSRCGKPSASILQLKHDPRGSGLCQTDEKWHGSWLGGGGKDHG